MNIVEYASKTYKKVDEKLLKLVVMLSAFIITLPIPALANTTQGGGKNDAFKIDDALNHMTGYNSKNVSFSAQTAAQTTQNAGTSIINMVATGSMIIGFFMVVWGLYSLKNLANQQASPEEKKKAWVFVGVGALLAIPTLLYALFAVVAGSTFTKSGTDGLNH